MNRIIFFLLVCIAAVQLHAQSNPALNMSEVLAYNARFNPADTRQEEVIKTLKPSYLITHLKTDNDKNTFWINIYNSYMLIFLRDTTNEGVYTNFYKKKNVTIAGKVFSLFEIEHEFLRLGKKNKTLGFKKSKLSKDTTWIKLRPKEFDLRVIYCMYRGLYAYPPFQVIENGDIAQGYFNSTSYISSITPSTDVVFDWIKPYLQINSTTKATKFIRTPLAVHIKNFYPKYEGIKFKDEEINPWLK